MSADRRFWIVAAIMILLVAVAAYWSNGRESIVPESAPVTSAPPIEVPVTPSAPQTSVEVEPADLPEPTADASGTISGMVLDTDDVPVPNADVEVRFISDTKEGRAEPMLVTCDATGSFVVDALPAGHYRVRAGRHGAQFPAVPIPNEQTVDVHANESVSGIKLTIPKSAPGYITGIVLDSNGVPIPNVAIQGMGGGAPVYAQTGVDGRFRLEDLTAEAYALFITQPGYSRKNLTGIPVYTENMEIRLDDVCSVTGMVVDAATGDAIELIELVCLPGVRKMNSGFWSFAIEQATAQGRFRVDDVDVGDATLYIRALGYKELLVPVLGLQPGEVRDLPPVKLELGGVVRGRVIDIAGTGIAGATVQMNSLSAVADPDGAFELIGLPDVPVMIYASKPDSEYARASVQYDPVTQKNEPIEIVMTAGGFVEGTIAGLPANFASDVDVSLAKLDDSDGLADSVPADRPFRLGPVVAGEYRIEAHSNEREKGLFRTRSANQLVNIVDSQTTKVVLNFKKGEATVEGRITREGVPVAECRVSLVRAEEMTEPDSRTTKSDAQGSFQFEELAPGAVLVDITARVQSETVTFTRLFHVNETGVTRADFELTSGVHVSGHVEGISQKEANMAMLIPGHVEMPNTLSQEFFGAHSPILGEQVDRITGEFQLQAVDAGDYTVLVYALQPDETDPDSALGAARFAYEHISVEADTRVELVLPSR